MNIEEIEKEINKLEEKRLKLWRQGDVVRAVKVQQEQKSLANKLILMEQKEKSLLHEMIAGLGEDEKDKFDIYTAMLLVLVDMADSVVTDINSMLSNISKDSVLQTTKIVRQIKKETAKFVHLSDRHCNTATAEDYGKLSDLLFPMIQKKTQEHLAWGKIENKNIRYATE